MKALGKRIVDFAPGEDNPRNSEGSFIRLNDRRIMFAYSRFTGNDGADEAPAQIVARYSDDEGESWSNARVLFRPEDFGAANIMSTSLSRIQNGALGLFFLIRYSWTDMRLHLFLSRDEGETFEDPIACIQAKGYYVTNNDRVVRLNSGRLIHPGNLHRLKSNGKFDPRGVGYVFYSDDDGKTWHEATDNLAAPTNKIDSGMQETGLIELRTGTLWAFSRTDTGVQYQSFSHDNGDTWSDPVPSCFTSPRSPMQMKRLIDDRILAIWNPIPNYNGRGLKYGWDRTPFVLATSADDGNKWTNPQYVETGSEDAGYSYPAVFVDKDYVLLGYCAGNREDGCNLFRLRIRKIGIDEID